MEDLRNDYPALQNQIYLNTASSGLMSTSLMEWRRAQDLDFNKHGIDLSKRQQIPETTRASIGRLFDASLSEIALIPNFSFGCNIILDGLSRGQKVLLLDDDYPSLKWPVETRDFNVCYATLGADVEGSILQALEKHKPDIFMFSLVQWLSGIKIDETFLRQIKATYPDMLLIADGTQFIGTQNFSFKNSPIDVLGASAYKWLCAGFGNGFMLIKESVQNRIYPKTIGFNSADTFESLATDTRFVKHFEPGHLDYVAFGSLNHSIEAVEKISLTKIEKDIQSLTDYAIDGLANLGFIDNAIYNRTHRSSIINFKGDANVYKNLLSNNISCSLRGGGIRVSFHHYNTRDEVSQLINTLK